MLNAELNTGKVKLTVQGNTQTELFKAMADAEEIFGEDTCGLCFKKNVIFQVRTVDDNDYFEMSCKTCGAKLAFGQNKNKKGCLFPKRKLDKDGKPDMKKGDYGPHKGWTKFKGKVEPEAD